MSSGGPEAAKENQVSEAEAAYQAGLRLLNYRWRSEAELLFRLKRRYPAAAVDEAVSRLKRSGYVDDERFVRWWIENRLRTKPMGPRRLRAELKAKHVADELIQTVLDDILNHTDLVEVALSLAEKRLKQRIGKKNRRKRLYDYLARRGFSYETIGSVLSRLDQELA